jgi:hypothetical protein
MLDRTRAGLRSGQPVRTLLPDPASSASDREPEVRYLHTEVRVCRMRDKGLIRWRAGAK